MFFGDLSICLWSNVKKNLTWDGKEIKYYLKYQEQLQQFQILEYGVVTQTTSATFQINNAKLYVPVVTSSINDNIKFWENIKQGFKTTISWNKYRSKITTQPKNNTLDYLIDSTFTTINRLFALSFKNDNDIFCNFLPASANFKDVKEFLQKYDLNQNLNKFILKLFLTFKTF